MIGFVALIFPLFLGGVVGFVLGSRARSRNGSLLRVLAEYVIGVGGVGLVLALAFAGFIDTLDGQASWSELFNYALWQIGFLSVLALPTTLFGWRDGRMK